MTANTRPNAPTHRLYVVKEIGESAKWIEIGAAFANKDGKGFSLSLDALPTDGRIVMRETNVGEIGGQS